MNNAPIILIHGWGMNKQVWNGVINACEPSLVHRIKVLDMPGYGDNLNCPSPYDIEALVAWLKSEVREPSHIIGWSLGGLLAQKFANIYPAQTLSLGLVASTPKFVAEGNWPGIKSEVLQAFSNQLTVSHEQTVKRFLKIQALGSESIKKDLKDIQDWVFSANPPNPKALVAGLKMLEEVDLRDTLATIQPPVFALFGGRDSLVPLTTAQRLSEKLPTIRISVQNKDSHAPFISNKDEFIRWLRTNFN
ncbi:pimeloyl-ACP methyl ester esterase BioH [Psychrosphaera aestuarii]|uniref:pimeloyl-ACP methyl ester esterase BioH n=1 Tax=Psychrosphaera aestuarii TaxID=1266052 RepID=UPI001B33265D|nr:pimeloyl-ACP methyl ester esterase BioH [Psychrosphaera aestuarii]